MAGRESPNTVPKVTLVLHPAAEADILEAYRWYEQRRVGLGVRFVTEVDDAFVRIAANPAAFAVALPGMRRLVLKRFPYIVYFRALDIVHVFGVLHGRRDRQVLRER